MMQAILTKVAGVDVHKEILVITAIVGEEYQAPRIERLECSTMTDDLKTCGDKLKALGVTHVAMESTGIYWKPVYNVWSRQGLIITLGNAQHIKNVPGRKTDVSDSQWIAQLHRNGLIRPSYVPEEKFQHLRALTRHRSNLVGDTTRVKNRVQKLLEDGNVKLASVIENVFGVSGLAVLRAIGESITDAESLTIRVCTNVKASKEEIKRSLTNCLTEVHCFEVKEYLRQFDALQDCLRRIDAEINTRMQEFSDLILRLDEIPGIDRTGAQAIIAEATTHMDAFGDDRRFAAWAGVAPGNKQSARKKKELGSDMATHI
jgi:transposase